MACPKDKGLQPQPMENWSAFFFFVAFVIVVSYTLLNLYIGESLHGGTLTGHRSPDAFRFDGRLLAIDWRSHLPPLFTAGARPTYRALFSSPGVVFSQFSRIRQQSQMGSAFLTNEQQEWAELSKMVFRLKPPDKCAVPRNKIRR